MMMIADGSRGKGSFNELLFAYLRFLFFPFLFFFLFFFLFLLLYIKINAGSKNVCFLLDKFYNVPQYSIDNRDQKKKCFGEMRQEETKSLRCRSTS